MQSLNTGLCLHVVDWTLLAIKYLKPLKETPQPRLNPNQSIFYGESWPGYILIHVCRCEIPVSFANPTGFWALKRKGKTLQ